ncbi:MAG: hypothetical protein HYV63_11385 [Candidatus Schekmanbacteria bacterium]|nr:hypothetical protein [Candidatus Schekmanbacteria bacterium]
MARWKVAGVALSVLLLAVVAKLEAQAQPAPREAAVGGELPDLPGSKALVPWADFARLLRILEDSRAQASALPTPPAPYAFSAARIVGRLSPDGSTCRLQIDAVVEVLVADDWVQVPIPAGDGVFRTIRLGGAPATVVEVGGARAVLRRGSGSTSISATADVPVTESQGRKWLTIGGPIPPGTTLELELPGTDLEVFVSRGLVTESSAAAGSTRVIASVAAPGPATVSWKKARAQAAPRTTAGRIHADAETALTVGEGILSGTSRVEVQAYGSDVIALSVGLPADYRLLDVQVSGARLEKTEDRRATTGEVGLAFAPGAAKRFVVNLSYEHDIVEGQAELALPVVDVRQADRQSGWLAVAAAGNVEVLETGASSNLSKVDPTELPAQLAAAANQQALFAYRYARVPYSGTIKVIRHEDLAVKPAIIEDAHLRTFARPDGKVLTEVTYRIKNNRKQFLRATLPAGAELWSAFLADRPVKPAQAGDALLLPLETTGGEQASGAATFTLSYVYFEKRPPFSLFGTGELVAPAASDLECLSLTWELFLPSELTYREVDGDVDILFEGHVAPPQPQRPMAARAESPYANVAGEVSDEEAQEAKDQSATAKEEVMAMVSNTVAQSMPQTADVKAPGGGEARGFLPVRIAVPAFGERYVGNARVIAPGEAPAVRWRYRRADLPGGGTVAGFLLSAVLVFVALGTLSRDPAMVGRAHGAMLMGVVLALGITSMAVQRGGAAVFAGALLGAAATIVYRGRLRRLAALFALSLAAFTAASPLCRADEPPVPATVLPDTRLAVPWNDLRPLLDRVIAALASSPAIAVPEPPVAHALSRLAFSGTVAPEGTTVVLAVDADLEVLTAHAWTSVPLFPEDHALMNALLDERPAPLITASGYVHVIVSGSGTHALRATLARPLPSTIDGTSLYLTLPSVAAGALSLELPLPAAEIEASGGIVTENAGVEGEKSRIAIALGGRPQLSVTWRPRRERGPATAEGKIEAETHTLVSIGEGLMQCLTSIDYRLQQKEATALAVELPGAATVLAVSGTGIDGHDEKEADGKRRVSVSLPFSVDQQYGLSLRYEIPLGGLAASAEAPLPALTVLGVDRQTGWMAVSARSNVEITAGRAEDGLTPVDPSELPEFFTHSPSPILYAYRYVRLPYAATVAVQKHDDVFVKRSVVDAAELTTYVGSDGKMLTRADYRVRNNQQQYLKISLPDGADVWGAYVDQRPVKAAKDDSGAVLVPLRQSSLQAQASESFPVSLIYFLSIGALGTVGQRTLEAPRVDLDSLEMRWTLYVPADFRYFDLGGEMTDVTRSGSWAVLAAKGVEYAQDFDDAAREVAGGRAGKPQDAPAQLPASVRRAERPPAKAIFEYNAAVQRAGSAKGVLPVQVQIPAVGTRLELAKTLIKGEEAVTVSLRFAAAGLDGVVGWMLFLAAAGATAIVLRLVWISGRRAPSRLAVAVAALLVGAVAVLHLGANANLDFLYPAIAAPPVILAGFLLVRGARSLP